MMYGSMIEWLVHKIAFHRWGKKKNSMFAFHLRDHHVKSIKDNFYDDISSYIKETGKEPIVHPLFRDLQNEKFLIDDVEKDFIYPVEQFGAIDKLIGEEKEYKEHCFLNQKNYFHYQVGM